MTSPVAAAVSLDGRPLAASASEFNASAVTVLSGVKVDWGRDTSVDQPAPSSCSLSIVQKGGSADFLNGLVTGRSIDVTASAFMPSEEIANIMSQGSFEAPLVPGDTPAAHTVNATVTVDQWNPHTGAQEALIVPLVASDTVVVFPQRRSRTWNAVDAIPGRRQGSVGSWSHGAGPCWAPPSSSGPSSSPTRPASPTRTQATRCPSTGRPPTSRLRSRCRSRSPAAGWGSR